ncbi:MAG: ACP S-malonyltransferase [Rhodospirillales bacterium]|jgi:[acyl-carrier-protein] S-malonyltransferase|nr:ACP S-malonyltransferase [Rhodospirillales bacterium]MDP6774648.1 ACP S-malonyltransferase [Rhodospirillales bacterium]
MIRTFVFPGQGSQAVGMGKELAGAFAAARHAFEEVDDALNHHLSRLMFEGPEEDLTLTENTQPALLAVSMAVTRVLAEDGGIHVGAASRFVAGHSLGEYSALVAAGALTLPDAARLVRTRGRAMQDAVPVGEGAMAALLGLDLDDARAVAEEAAEGEVCTAANDNAPGQVVVSGARTAIERVLEIAADHGAKRAIMLPVSAPFHCALMAPAADVMAGALAEVEMAAPEVPLIANVRAAEVTEPDEIRELLVEQVTGTVRWRESVLYMKEKGVEAFVELGTGKVLCGLVRRIDRGLSCVSLGAPRDIEDFLKTL